jgi:hypothetical protein
MDLHDRYNVLTSRLFHEISRDFVRVHTGDSLDRTMYLWLRAENLKEVT